MSAGQSVLGQQCGRAPGTDGTKQWHMLQMMATRCDVRIALYSLYVRGALAVDKTLVGARRVAYGKGANRAGSVGTHTTLSQQARQSARAGAHTALLLLQGLCRELQGLGARLGHSSVTAANLVPQAAKGRGVAALAQGGGSAQTGCWHGRGASRSGTQAEGEGEASSQYADGNGGGGGCHGCWWYCSTIGKGGCTGRGQAGGSCLRIAL